jgi:hypothetical protein
MLTFINLVFCRVLYAQYRRCIVREKVMARQQPEYTRQVPEGAYCTITPKEVFTNFEYFGIR